MIIRNARWCDLVKYPDGTVELVYLFGATVFCAERWTVDAGQALLYLRAAADGQGRVCAIGQGHNDGQAWATIEGGAPFSLGPTHGVFPVLIFGDSLGWVAFVQRAASTYETVRVHSGGGHVKLLTREMPPTSQGFLYVASDGTPITQDRGRGAIPGLALPSPAGDVWVGQSMTAATLALFDSDTGAITPLDTPGGQPPHIVESGGTYYVCSYVEGGAWLSTHRRPFAAALPPPPVDPPKEPPVADVREVPNRVNDVVAARDLYPIEWRLCHKDYPQDGSRTTREEAERFIRLLAYNLHQNDPRWGLNGKRATDELSQDALCFRHDDGRESVVDVVLGAGGDHPSPMWDVVGRYRVAGDGQKWIRPERVNASQPPATPPTQPPVTTPPVTPSAPTVDLGPVLAELSALRGEVQALRGEMARADRLDDIVHTSRREHNEKLDALLQRPEPTKCVLRR